MIAGVVAVAVLAFVILLMRIISKYFTLPVSLLVKNEMQMLLFIINISEKIKTMKTTQSGISKSMYSNQESKQGKLRLRWVSLMLFVYRQQRPG